MQLENQDGPLAVVCERCAVGLQPGKGNFYFVKIEAVADPTPPTFSAEDLDRDHRQEIERLLVQMRELSEQELVDQVYRQMTFCLCGPCYRQWIENPVGSE